MSFQISVASDPLDSPLTATLQTRPPPPMARSAMTQQSTVSSALPQLSPFSPAANTYDDRLTSDTCDANGSTVSSGGHTYNYDFENDLMHRLDLS